MPTPESDTAAKLRDVLISFPKIISGGDGRHPEIRKLFWSTVAMVFFRKLHQSFRDRSKGSNDELGATWNPLRPRTIKIKRRAHKRRGRTLPPSRHPTWINYDTGDLLAAAKPGKVSGDTYLPPKDQTFELHLDKLVLGIQTEYAEEVHKLRPLYSDKQVEKWVEEAVTEACKAIIPRVRALKP